MYNEKYRIEENIVNIAMRAAELLMAGKIERDDMTGHAGLTEYIIQMAEDFEKKNAGVDFDAQDRDYWEEIDDFTEEQLLSRYAVEKESESKPLDIKVIIDSGCVHAVLKDQDTPVNVEVVDVDPDYEDYEQLDAYRNQLYKDPLFQNCDYTVARFDEEPEQPEVLSLAVEAGQVNVLAVFGNADPSVVFTGNWDECEQFCKENNWCFFDEHNFRWDLEIKDSREVLFPEGYHTAVNHYCDMIGTDIENEFVRQHADKLVYCYENNLCFEDFVSWGKCEEILGEPLSLDEYISIEEQYDVTSLEDPAYSPFLDEIKGRLAESRASTVPVSSRASLNDLIYSASHRTGEKSFSNKPKQKEFDHNH